MGHELAQEVVQHPFGMIKTRMDGVHFLLKRQPKVRGNGSVGLDLQPHPRELNILGFLFLIMTLGVLGMSVSRAPGAWRSGILQSWH
jgi:hypothetical protein